MNLKFREFNVVNAASATQVDDVPVVTLGTVVKAVDIDPSTNFGEVELVYLKATGTEVVGSGVVYDGKYTAVVSAAGLFGQFATSISAKSINQYGWYVISGNRPSLINAGCPSGAKLYLAPSGALTNTAGTGNEVLMGITTSAESGGLATIFSNRAIVIGV